MYILGINETHNSSAALLKDGLIVAAAQEERFTRVKNQGGFPKKAIDFCLKQNNINIEDIDLVVFGGSNPFKRFTTATDSLVTRLILPICKLIPVTFNLYQFFLSLVYNCIAPFTRKYHLFKLSALLKIDRSKIRICDHHIAHGYAAYYTSGISKDKDCLVITNDGGGGGFSGKVFVVKNNNWTKIASTPEKSSLAAVYYNTTQLLGFTPDEEEYKVMGLAGYIKNADLEEILTIFRKLIWCKGLSFRSKIPAPFFYQYLEQNISKKRFDYIAFGLQKLTEDLLVEQVKNAIKLTGISSVVLGGGLAMNIKSNMKVSEIKEIKHLCVGASTGDESNAIGNCFFGYSRLCKEKGITFSAESVKNLYLGSEFNIDEVEDAIKKELTDHKLFEIKKLNSKSKAKILARLLAEGKVIARFAGKMEFGARALGNRSILADPRDSKVIRVINDSIKQRDFWMPFAPTILENKAGRYLINPKGIKSPFMMIGFETNIKAGLEIPATLHPYDLTCRPQILASSDNPDFYDIIREFEKLTGIPAVLNTSFNLHGQPIVCSPEDALKTFLNSRLKYLVLKDYLLIKNGTT